METVVDPVCGMRLNPATASAMIVHGNHTHYFCSVGCERKFQADPGRYETAGEEAGAEVPMEEHEPPHTTTGSFTAPKFGSAGSGGLEYEPLPEAHDDGRPSH